MATKSARRGFPGLEPGHAPRKPLGCRFEVFPSLKPRNVPKKHLGSRFEAFPGLEPGNAPKKLLGSHLGPSCPHLRPSLAHRGHFDLILEAIMTHLVLLLAHLRCFLPHLGCILEDEAMYSECDLRF